MAITVDPKSNKLIVRFRVTGHIKQFYLNSGLKDSAKNRVIVDSRWEEIQREISLGIFDPTLVRYRFGVKEIPQTIEYSLSELWEKFTEFKSAQLEQTTLLGKYKSVRRYVDRLPSQKLADAAIIRNWMLVNFTSYMTWQLLGDFCSCCEWAVGCGLIKENPFAKLKIQKPKKSSRDDDYRAFTLEQRDIIIQAFENHPKHSHYAPLIKFLFWSGCRPGEAFALTWGDISNDCCRISINKSRNYHRILKGTKNGKKRVFPCQSGSKLQSLLLSIRPVGAIATDLVFVSTIGKQINSDSMSVFWRSRRSQRGEIKYKYPGVVRELADKGIVPYLKPYATRHTFATWAISSGNSPDKVAYWLGDNTATVLAYYCHPEVAASECPDF
ncbi:site-specific recombinase XerD [Cylindrospermum stagnale PCC 7417]|uniref:Site-specific recombinase XerD n=1 Tax=Cylindrospermum stagnale PCC 7417 TaxID=56107 RepID=K9WX26_9NOST|nr:site-specific integrase [Cylindrospermum stagnale]AFZ24758.1 site-specific recombinase XerD [Cylindrospermum stagnale PCC 7417]